jgi:hypothetical protein
LRVYIAWAAGQLGQRDSKEVLVVGDRQWLDRVKEAGGRRNRVVDG